MTELRVLALSGSLREKSYNTALLREAQRLAPHGMTIVLASIREFPLYDADLEARAFPQAAKDVSASIANAGGGGDDNTSAGAGAAGGPDGGAFFSNEFKAAKRRVSMAALAKPKISVARRAQAAPTGPIFEMRT